MKNFLITLTITTLTISPILAQDESLPTVIETKNITTKPRPLQVIVPKKIEEESPVVPIEKAKTPKAIFQNGYDVSPTDKKNEVIKEVPLSNLETLPEDQRGLEGEKDRGYYDTWSFWYIRGGSSVIKYNGKSTRGVNSAIGHRKFSNSFYYGAEYNTVFKKKVIITQNYLLTAGWHPNWKHSVQPFVGFFVGASSIDDKQNNISANGYLSGMDAGFRITWKEPFHVYTGTRLGFGNYDNSQLSSFSHQDLYVLFAVEF